jgi:CubicO group peptidase (beta-lactamase class C family)
MPYALRIGDIAGAAVVVVRRGAVISKRGWGYADVAKRSPVDPQRTLFRVGSTGKLFTWTAVMQLVERGRLDLDADINTYLDFTIPPRDGRPITMRNLMTHTPGFEERIKHLAAANPDSLLPLDEYVRRWTPRRIYPPGETIAYSNYGVTLAGYIVQRVSGIPYDEYLERNLFGPLGMTRTTSRQPLPQSFAADMSAGYAQASLPPRPFELFGVGPAGGHTATPADMGRFMLAYLGRGRLGQSQILREQTVAEMWAPTFAALDPLPAMGLGFFRDDRNGRVVLGHAGDSQYFHSVLQLLPGEDVGIFVVTNSTGRSPTAGLLRGALFRGFMDRYFPDPAPAPPTAKTAAKHANMIAGRYWSSRRADTTFMSLLNLLGEITVAPQPDGTIVVSAIPGLNGVPKRWREIAPYVWREVDGDSRLVGRVKGGGAIALATDDLPLADVLLPAPPMRLSSWNLPLLALSLAVLALTLLARPVRAFARWRWGKPNAFQDQRALSERLVAVTAFINLAFIGGYLFVALQVMGNLSAFDAPLDPWLHGLQALGLLSVVGTGVAIWNFAQTWRDTMQGWWANLWSGVIVLACFDIVWIGYAFHLIRWSVEY